MTPVYYVVDSFTGKRISASIHNAQNKDFSETRKAHWQTDWFSAFIQDAELKKYALKTTESKELVGLGAYRDVPSGVIVYIEYIEAAPSSNPTLSERPQYKGVGAALLAFGVQLSIDLGYGGAIYLKAKTSELREHYISDFGAIPFSRADPFMLLIEGDAAQSLMNQYVSKEDDQ